MGHIMLYIRFQTVEICRDRQKIDKIESMTTKEKVVRTGKMGFFPKKGHSKIWAANFFPSPQSRRQVSANDSENNI